MPDASGSLDASNKKLGNFGDLEAAADAGGEVRAARLSLESPHGSLLMSASPSGISRPSKGPLLHSLGSKCDHVGKPATVSYSRQCRPPNRRYCRSEPFMFSKTIDFERLFLNYTRPTQCRCLEEFVSLL